MVTKRQRRGFWLMGLGTVTLALLIALTTQASGLFIFTFLVLGTVAWNTRRTKRQDPLR